jgi:DUF1680 family protein
VTTTWIQLNLQLLRLTGGAAFADEIERSLYNHLTAAQNPRGDDWCYYTALEGLKHYDKEITCCHSSGPRALALAPTAAYLQTSDTLYVSTFVPSRARFRVGGDLVEIVQDSSFPVEGKSVLVVRAAKPVRFAMKVRVPQWAAPLRAGSVHCDGGWASLPAQTWRDGDRIDLTFSLKGRVIRGEYTNFARVALAWGPFILAVDATRNPRVDSIPALRIAPDAEPVLTASAGGLLFRTRVQGAWEDVPFDATLVPFADAGASGGEYRVWLRTGR